MNTNDLDARPGAAEARCRARTAGGRARLLATVSILASACQANYPTVPTATTAAIELHVTFPAAAGALSAGTFFNYAAYAVDTDGAYKDVTRQAVWSADPSVVSFNFGSTFNMRAVGPGVTDVSATYDGRTGSLRTFVDPGCCPPTVQYPYLVLQAGAPRAMGQSDQAQAWLHEAANSARRVTELATWTSSAPHIASVDRGLVGAHLPGTFEITASYNGVTSWYRWSIPPRQ